MAVKDIKKLRKELADAAKEEVARLNQVLDEHVKKFEKPIKRRDELLAKQQELQAEINQITQQLNDEYLPEHAAISAELSQAARDTQGKFMSDNP